MTSHRDIVGEVQCFEHHKEYCESRENLQFAASRLKWPQRHTFVGGGQSIRPDLFYCTGANDVKSALLPGSLIGCSYPMKAKVTASISKTFPSPESRRYRFGPVMIISWISVVRQG